ncbi:MAG: hypothetical protein U5L08_07310 [Xanthomonadales bacterium]|nr:hypothetical protein [Xanthomonadales bacterium]
MREPELSKEVMALAERAARLCVARAPAPIVLPALPQSDVLPAHEASILDEAGLDISEDLARGHADPAAQTVVDVMHMLSSPSCIKVK